MINRELIRLKVVQIVYGAHFNAFADSDKVWEELEKSLQQSYDLYHYLLKFLIDLRRVAEKQVEAGIQRWHRVGLGDEPSRRFIDGAFIRQLEDNEQLCAYCANEKWTWMDHEQYLMRTYQKVLASDYYQKYMALPSPTYKDHRQVWYDLYVDCVCNNDFIDSVLEDRGLFWNDDKFIVDSFALRTIQSFREANGEAQPLLAQYRDSADREFARTLLLSAVKGEAAYADIIAAHLQPGWGMERIARMDSVIMLVALAEICNCPDIPLRVTINEYIEIAKTYSTPQSGRYINGMLDAMARTLRERGLTAKDASTTKTTNNK